MLLSWTFSESADQNQMAKIAFYGVVDKIL